MRKQVVQAIGVIVGLPLKGLMMALGGIKTSAAILVKHASQFLAVNNANSSLFLDMSTNWLEGILKHKRAKFANYFVVMYGPELIKKYYLGGWKRALPIIDYRSIMHCCTHYFNVKTDRGTHTHGHVILGDIYG